MSGSAHQDGPNPGPAEAGIATKRRMTQATAASAAIAAGAPGVGRSFRFHRPRGPICGDGWCFQCEIGGALACCSSPGRATPRRDLLRPLGLLAERHPPWFYERRMLRPRALRGRFLHVLRYLSAAPPLGDASVARSPRAYRVEDADVVVAGDAPAPAGAVRVGGAAGSRVVGVYPQRTIGVLDGDVMREIHFQRLVVAAGSRVRLPPIAGNDLPGVLALDALARYAAAGLPPGGRLAIWGPDAAVAQARTLADAHRLTVVWSSAIPPLRILGRGQVTGIDVGREVACDLFVAAVAQPALELALQAGATARLTEGELPVLVLDDAPDWLDVVGTAANAGSGVPDIRGHDAAFACLCEDVRVRDLRACVAQGFQSAELVKRRTGAMTGPCQGKLCASAVLAELRTLGVAARPTTARPLAAPLTLAELAADG